MLAWHFLADDARIRANADRHGWGSPHSGVQVVARQTLRVEAPLIAPGSVAEDSAFAHGLFGSYTAAEALCHAPGLMVCRVELGGQLLPHARCAQATERTCLWMYDATNVVWEWGCLCCADYIRRAHAEGLVIPPLVTEAIQARWRWFSASPRKRDSPLVQLVNPTLQVMRRACGLSTQGKETGASGADWRIQAATRLAHALTLAKWKPDHNVASRPEGWYETELGQLENKRLESLLVTEAKRQMGC